MRLLGQTGGSSTFLATLRARAEEGGLAVRWVRASRKVLVPRLS